MSGAGLTNVATITDTIIDMTGSINGTVISTTETIITGTIISTGEIITGSVIDITVNNTVSDTIIGTVTIITGTITDITGIIRRHSPPTPPISSATNGHGADTETSGAVGAPLVKVFGPFFHILLTII